MRNKAAEEEEEEEAAASESASAGLKISKGLLTIGQSAGKFNKKAAANGNKLSNQDILALTARSHDSSRGTLQ